MISRFFAGKPGRAETPVEPATAESPLEIDEELFAARGQCSGEALRGLLSEANGQINALDGIKAALGKLIDPISKALGDFEATQIELRRLQAAKAEHAADAAVQRGKAADLEKRLAQQTGECIALCDEKVGLDERLALAAQRNAALEKLLAEAHDLLLARAEQNREQSRRAGALAAARDALQARLSDLEARLLARESELKSVEQARTLYLERNAALARAFTAKEAAFAQAERAIEQLAAALHREKWERAQTEEALQAARQDYARAMRDMMAMQRNLAEPVAPPRRAANAA